MDNQQQGSGMPMPDPKMNFGQQGGAQMGILQKMSGGAAGQEPPDPAQEHFQSVNLLTQAIKSLNQYASMMQPKDDANARAARYIISILGAMLKTAQHEDQMETQGLTSV